MSPALSPPPAAAPGPGMLARETGCHTPLLSVAGSPGRHTLHFPPGGHASSSEPEAAPSHVKHQPLGSCLSRGPCCGPPSKTRFWGDQVSRPGASGLPLGLSPLSSWAASSEVRGPQSLAHLVERTFQIPSGKAKGGSLPHGPPVGGQREVARRPCWDSLLQCGQAPAGLFWQEVARMHRGARELSGRPWPRRDDRAAGAGRVAG